MLCFFVYWLLLRVCHLANELQIISIARLDERDCEVVRSLGLNCSLSSENLFYVEEVWKFVTELLLVFQTFAFCVFSP
jgi:hypothetical protein